jgi:ABC-2 type transport system ATP-binding protein
VHDGSGRIVVQNLTKHFGQVVAVQNLSFHVEPGSVTGFLGPNGAGKTTTLRMLLGLVTPTAGHATINGQPFHHLGNPARVVGAVLEAQGFHPTRSARDHLRVYAAAMGVPDQRADQVLGLVGLTEAGFRKAGGFSLGMKQRLALATALLGDPQVLVLDEPANGLDPEGIAWLRTFLKAFAGSGRTVLISSHQLAEVEQTIDQVVIISRGQTMYYGPLETLRTSQQSRVVVQPADPNKLVAALQEAGITEVQPLPDNKIAVTNATVQQIGDVAAKAGVALYGVQEERADLEQLFFRLTSGQFAAPQQTTYGQMPQAPQGGYPPPPVPGFGPPQQQGYQQQQGGYAVPANPPGGWAPQQQPQHSGGYAGPATSPGGWGQEPAPGTPPGGWGPPQQQAPPPTPGGWGQEQASPPAGWGQQQQPPPPGNWGQEQNPAPGTPPGGWAPQPQQGGDHSASGGGAPQQGGEQPAPGGWGQEEQHQPAPPQQGNQQPNQGGRGGNG